MVLQWQGSEFASVASVNVFIQCFWLNKAALVVVCERVVSFALGRCNGTAKKELAEMCDRNHALMVWE